MAKFEAGQKVIVLTPLHRNPDRYTPATVIKVARKYVTVREDERATVAEFSMETGRLRDCEGNYAKRVYTLEEMDRRDRLARVHQALLDAKVRVEYGNTFTLEQQEEIVKLIQSFPAAQDQ